MMQTAKAKKKKKKGENLMNQELSLKKKNKKNYFKGKKRQGLN